jgi:serine/threonine protein kinase
MPDHITVDPLRITPDLHPGYRLLRLRGKGSFGEVWEAAADGSDPIALKFLPCARGQAAHELRSILMVRQLSHPGLVRVDRVWSVADFLVVAMELADGSLADLLEIYRTDLGTALPFDHLLPLLAQAADALDFLNNSQHYHQDQWFTIQHCDVTPNNLLLFGKTVKLSDFGLTTALASREKAHYRAGTPSYAGPEVFLGRVSDRTDQYALAVCYCVLRAGRLPFPDMPAAFEPGYLRPAPDLEMLEPWERPVVARALAPVPQDRWSSCGELVLQLGKAAGTAVAETDRAERRRGPRHEPGAGLVCEVLPTLGNQAWDARILNISTGGLRLRLSRPGCPLRPGRVLELVLRGRVQGQPVAVRLRLTHGSECENGDYEVGGAFDRPLTAAELETLCGGPA